MIRFPSTVSAVNTTLSPAFTALNNSDFALHGVLRVKHGWQGDSERNGEGDDGA